MKICLLFFILIGAYQALAADLPCSPMDLNEKEPLNEMPVLNQGDTQTCYAFAAAQLLDFHLRNQGIKQSISPVDFALLCTSKDWLFPSESIGGGFTSFCLERVAKYGVATNECVEKAIADFTHDTHLNSNEFLSLLEKIYENYERPLRGSVGIALETGTVQELKTILHADKNIPACSEDALVDLLAAKSLLGAGTTSILTHILYPCAGERKPIHNLTTFNKDIDVFFSGSDQEIKKLLDQVLNRGEPAEVSVCAQILKGRPSFRGLVNFPPLYSRTFGGAFGSCAGHALLAVGRRVSAGRCQYLLRNSWGANWQGPGLSCACKTPHGYYPDCDTLMQITNTPASARTPQINALIDDYKNRSFVGCWVDSDNLAPNLRSVVGFK